MPASEGDRYKMKRDPSLPSPKSAQGRRDEEHNAGAGKRTDLQIGHYKGKKKQTNDHARTGTTGTRDCGYQVTLDSTPEFWFR
jgi:hypothetical protein